MIPNYELRIGNYVLFNDTLEQVTVITGTGVSGVKLNSNQDASSDHDLETIQPVPLTDEVLKQCGFVYHDYFKFWQLITTGIRSEMNISPDYEVIDFMRKPILKKLTSLHQLQNVYFMLKGRELNFNQATSIPISN